jgi:AGCS family alanine or glycine:cation symporter
VDEQDVGQGFFAALDGLFGEWVVAPIRTVFMFDLAFWDNGTAGEIELPLVVVWLALGALFFTLRFQFVNFRAFRHALDCVRGRYSRPDDPGEITHFQALSAALSATVGLGNIAGVAFAVAMGGPGAVFWMVLAGILGMSSKFAECTLGQKYRIVRADGHVSGGPMHYLRTGLCASAGASAAATCSRPTSPTPRSPTYCRSCKAGWAPRRSAACSASSWVS